jgi:hypothetical protein
MTVVRPKWPAGPSSDQSPRIAKPDSTSRKRGKPRRSSPGPRGPLLLAAFTAAVISGCTGEIRAREVPIRDLDPGPQPAFLDFETDPACDRITPPVCFALEAELSRTFGQSRVVAPDGPVTLSLDGGARAVGALRLISQAPSQAASAAVTEALLAAGWRATDDSRAEFVRGQGVSMFRLRIVSRAGAVQVAAFGPVADNPTVR